MVEVLSVGFDDMLRLFSNDAKLWRRPALGGARSIVEPNSRCVDQLDTSSGLELM